jgi:hypothetical protein
MRGFRGHTPEGVASLWLTIALQLALPHMAMGKTGPLFAVTLGGNQTDTIRAVATDAAQNIFVAGETSSSDFPGAASLSMGRRAGDAFVVKLNSAGTQILYSVVLSGTGYDSARGIVVDSNGYVYVTGVTTSADFPVTAGAYQRSSNSPGLEEAFVAKLSPAGTLVYVTYFGGSGRDLGLAIAIDASGAAYIAGSTSSLNLPIKNSAQQSYQGGSSDCFVAKVDPSGATISYSTYLGGENADVCNGIAVDASGAAFVTGTTTSYAFPVVGALKQTLNDASSDAFLTKFSPAGNHFAFSTYLGGDGAEDGNVVRVDSSGTVYVGGDTSSSAFPVTTGAMQGQLNGGYDGFVCAVANDGSRIIFATYLGGSGSDVINDLFVAQDGSIAVAGYTSSADFPVVNAFQGSFGGSFDAFVAVLGAGGKTLNFASYLGGLGDDRAYGVAPLAYGQLVVAGQIVAGTVPYVARAFSSAVASNQDGVILAVTYLQPLRFVPITPCRVVDTRNALGPFGGPSIAGGSSRAFVITSGSCGIPSSAQAYSLSVAVVPPGQIGYVALWPTGKTQPSVSTLNSDGRVKSNAAIVPAGTGGSITAYSSDSTDMLLDINGYFVAATDPTALAFFPINPCRVADTRSATGPLGGPSLPANQSRTFPVQAACNLPASAKAYSLNLTAVPSSVLWFLAAWPTGQPQPYASTLNDPTATVVANAAIVPAGSNGSIDLYSSSATDLVIDVNGYFAPMAPGGLSLYGVTPCRVLDTRFQGSRQPFTAQDVAVSASGCGIPIGAQAQVFNVTVVPPAPMGFLSMWPQGQTRPLVSTLNAFDGSVTANMAIVPTTNGSISLFASSLTHVVLDVSGYFAQ